MQLAHLLKHKIQNQVTFIFYTDKLPKTDSIRSHLTKSCWKNYLLLQKKITTPGELLAECKRADDWQDQTISEGANKFMQLALTEEEKKHSIT